MKITSTTPPKFTPTTISITCETPEELIYLLSIANTPY